MRAIYEKDGLTLSTPTQWRQTQKPQPKLPQVQQKKLNLITKIASGKRLKDNLKDILEINNTKTVLIQENNESLQQDQSPQQISPQPVDKPKKLKMEDMPFQFDKVRQVEDIVEELKDLLPKNNSKKINMKDKYKNPYVLRSLDKLRKLDIQQKRFLNKMDSLKSHLTIYEQLQVKPAVQGLQPLKTDELQALTERTRNNFSLISQTEKKMRGTLYNKKELQVMPLTFKNDIFKQLQSPLGNNTSLNPDDSIISQQSFGHKPQLDLTDQSKIKRYLKNTKLLHMIKNKLQSNPDKHSQIIQAFVKINLINEHEVSQLSAAQYESLISMIENEGFTQEFLACFEMKDLLRHGLMLEDYTVKLQLLQIKEACSVKGQSRNKSQISMFSSSIMPQLKTSYTPQELQDFQREFMIKRKRAEDNLEKYEREKTQSPVLEGTLTKQNPFSLASDSQKSFMSRYIEQNKITLSGELQRFPSVEAHKKFSNEYSPSHIDQKQLWQAIKEAEQEKIIRKNKLVLEKLIVILFINEIQAERQRKQQEEQMRLMEEQLRKS